MFPKTKNRNSCAEKNCFLAEFNLKEAPKLAPRFKEPKANVNLLMHITYLWSSQLLVLDSNDFIMIQLSGHLYRNLFFLSVTVVKEGSLRLKDDRIRFYCDPLLATHWGNFFKFGKKNPPFELKEKLIRFVVNDKIIGEIVTTPTLIFRWLYSSFGLLGWRC